MFDTAHSKAVAAIDQSIAFPDFFSGRNCKGSQDITYCRALRAAQLCAKEMLRDGLRSGAVQLVLYLSGGS